MRIAFGLVGLLVTVAIMMYLFSIISIPTAKTGQQAQQRAQKIAGIDDNGQAVVSSFEIDPQMRGGRLDNLLVTKVVPGGGADRIYGLKAGDKIVEISTHGILQKVSDTSNNDATMAKDLIHEASRDTEPIVVIRNGQRITLPLSASSAAPGGAQPAGGLQGQLNNINNSVPIPTH